MGDRASARRAQSQPRALRHPLLRADRAAIRDRRLRQRALRRRRDEGSPGTRHRVHAPGRGRAGESQLWPARGAARRDAGGNAAPGAALLRAARQVQHPRRRAARSVCRCG